MAQTNLKYKAPKKFGAGGIMGGGGKGGGGSSGSTPIHEDSESLRSASFARVIDALCEGEIAGLVDINGVVQDADHIGKGVYLDGIPLMGSNGEWNFVDVKIEQRTGTPDQSSLSGFTSTENTNALGTRLRFPPGGTIPVLFSVTNQDVDQIEIGIRIPSLMNQDKTNGNIYGTKVEFHVEVRLNGGAWTNQFNDKVEGKTTSSYIYSRRITLPRDGSPTFSWDVRVTRDTPDSDTGALQNETYLDYVTEIINAKFKYTNTAIVGLQVSAQQFSSIPARSFDCKLLLIKVPVNYDPATRSYATTGPGTSGGGWDGTFKVAWSDNPAWAFYDICSKERYGLGSYFTDGLVDKWTLYTIAQYCDELVPNGFGQSEPRFTCNLFLQTREQAYKVVSDMASIFRAMIYWGEGKLIPVQDRPKSAFVHFSNANVKDGRFEYKGSAKKARHTSCKVRWVNPQNEYLSEIESVDDLEGVARYGLNELELTAFGCTSRAQAHRLGLWALYTERRESDLVVFSTGLEAKYLRPGDIFKVSDSFRAGISNGGRILVISGDRKTVTLDKPVIIEAGALYQLLTQNPQPIVPYAEDLGNSTEEGSRRTPQIATSTVTNSPFSGVAVLTLADALPANVKAGYVWTLQSDKLALREFRTLACEENEAHEFSVTAMEYDKNKFAELEQNIVFDPVPFSVLPASLVTPQPPATLTLSQRLEINEVSATKIMIDIAWDAVDNPFVSGYAVYVTVPDGAKKFIGQFDNQFTSYEVLNAGRHFVQVYSVTRLGKKSLPVEGELTVSNEHPEVSPYVTHLEIFGQGNDNTFLTQDVRLSWRLFSVTLGQEIDVNPLGNAPVDPYFKRFEVSIFDAAGVLLRSINTLVAEYTYLFTDNVIDPGGPHRSFKVEVRAIDIFGGRSEPASLVVANPAPPLPEFVTLSSLNGNIIFKCASSSELDFAGFLVWVSLEDGFDPNEIDPVYDGVANPAIISVAKEATYYVRFAQYDKFGKVLIDISDQQEISTTFKVNPFPPSSPTGLSLTTEIQLQPSGEQNPIITATWNAVSEPDATMFEVGIKQEPTGSYISTATTEKRFSWPVVAGETYSVRVRAVNTSGVSGPYSVEASITAAADTIAPGPITGISIASSFKTIFLTWDNPPDPDMAYVEVYESSTNNRANADMTKVVGTVFSRGYTATGITRYFWLRPVDTSGNVGDYSPAGATSGVYTTTGQIVTTDITTFAVDASKLFVGTVILKDDVWTDNTGSGDNISWNAHKLYYKGVQYNISAGTTALNYLSWKGGTSYVGSTANPTLTDGQFMIATNTGGLHDLAWNALANAVIGSAYIQNAAIINAKIADLAVDTAKMADLTVTTAKIADLAVTNAKIESLEAAKVVITGSTTLEDWKQGGDETNIAGGAISANTITANKMNIGLRGVTITGIQFNCKKDVNNVATNVVTWSSGKVVYTNNAGNLVAKSIASGQASWSSGTVYIYFDQGETVGQLLTTTLSAEAFDPDCIVLATYIGGINLVVTYGRTIIDGAQITALSITAAQIRAQSITATQIAASTITASQLAATLTMSNTIIIGVGSSGHIRSANYDGNTANVVGDPFLWERGTQGWILRNDGTADFNSIYIRDSAVSNTAFVGGSISIGLGDVPGEDLNKDTGFAVDGAGNLWLGNRAFANAPFRITNGGEMYFSSLSNSIPVSARNTIAYYVQLQIPVHIAYPVNGALFLIWNNRIRYQVVSRDWGFTNGGGAVECNKNIGDYINYGETLSITLSGLTGARNFLANIGIIRVP